MRAGSDGVYVAAPIWNNFMRSLLRDVPNETFPDYQRVESSIPMVTSPAKGKILYYSVASGKRISEEKARRSDPKKVRQKVEGGEHDILYYLKYADSEEKDAFPRYDDDMMMRWDRALSGGGNEEDEKI